MATLLRIAELEGTDEPIVITLSVLEAAWLAMLVGNMPCTHTATNTTYETLLSNEEVRDKYDVLVELNKLPLGCTYSTPKDE